MKLLVFGANGGTGQEVVKQALQQGHEVTAFVRNPGSLAIQDKNLKTVTGNALDLASVAAALPGHDAVISVIGAPATKKSTVRTESTKIIMEAMQKSKVKRFITQSTIGAGDSKPMLPALYKYVLVPLLLKGTFMDHEGQERAVQGSKLDWTIVRAGALNNKPHTGKYRVDIPTADKESFKISRADAADFILKELAQNNFVCKVVAVAY